jgi:hypothetical protein
MMKYLLNRIQKIPKEAFVDENVYMFIASPRWTYGRESNRVLPRGQRIRAKQQTVTPLLHRPKTREHLRRCCRFRGPTKQC